MNIATIDIHLPTLLLISIALNVLIGALLWWIYHLRGQQSCFLHWALACIVFAAGSLLAGARIVIDAPFITVFLAHSLLGLSPLLVLSGLQRFCRLPPKQNRWFRCASISSFSIYLVALLLTFEAAPNLSRAATAFLSTLIFSVAIYRISAIATRVQMPVRVLQLLFTVHGVLMMVQALVILSDSLMGQVQQLDLILRLILINHILLATGTALSLPLMAFTVSERRLRVQAEHDGLTGLLNRRSLFRHGVRSFNSARANQLPLAVLMLDIDHFKTVNDRWGHPAGDEALKVVANTLRSELRDNDIIGRIGGEEFALVLPLSCEDNLKGITNRLLQAISENGGVVDGIPMALSASIGGIELTPDHKSFADMMIEADSALYSAKNNGRNRAELTNVHGTSAIQGAPATAQ